MIMSPRNLMVLTLAFSLPLMACGMFEDDSPPVIIPDNDDDEEDLNEQNANNNDGEELAYDSEACDDDSDCLSGTCFEGDDWPDGHCTTVGCESFEDCETGTAETTCLNNPHGDNYCAESCNPSASDECRDDYECVPYSDGDGGYCSGVNIDDGNAPWGSEFQAGCEEVTFQSAEFNYEIDSGTDSYMVVPYSTDGGYMVPDEVITPSGQTIDFRGDNEFQLRGGSQIFGVINPTVIPATPNFEHQLESGTHTFRVQSDDSEICYYVVQDSGDPTTLDLNIYTVGLPGVDADSAATDPDLQEMMGHVEDIFEQSQVELGDVRYKTVSSEAEQNHGIVRGYDDVQGLAAESEQPGSTDSELLSANIFITEQFSLSDGRAVLGISLGIPGAAGMHGSSLSGVAMTGEYLGNSDGGNQLSANILAHELGHFLGLYHTSEQDGDNFDPLDDTPECEDMSSMTGCEDWGNLMFPGADVGNNELTLDQSFVIGVNPLTQ